MNTFPYIILLKGKLFVIELPERPQTKGWMSAGECGCFVNTSCACMDWANARSAAIEKRIEVENPDNIRMNSKGELRWVESNIKMVGKLQEFTEGEEVRWPGTWEKTIACGTCDSIPNKCLNKSLPYCALSRQVARLLAPEQKDSVTQLKEGLPSEDLIVAFAKWYSGMDEVKVRTAYKRWLSEKGSLNG